MSRSIVTALEPMPVRVVLNDLLTDNLGRFDRASTRKELEALTCRVYGGHPASLYEALLMYSVDRKIQLVRIGDVPLFEANFPGWRSPTPKEIDSFTQEVLNPFRGSTTVVEERPMVIPIEQLMRKRPKPKHTPKPKQTPKRRQPVRRPVPIMSRR